MAASSHVELHPVDGPSAVLDPLRETECQTCLREARHAARTPRMFHHDTDALIRFLARQAATELAGVDEHDGTSKRGRS